MDGDVVRAEGQAAVQGAAEALRRILRQSRDQVHIHMGKTALRRQLHGFFDVAGAVAAANGPEDAFLHGLGVYGDAVNAVGL